jgi:UDP-N-acetylglucosamine 2-epimerase (non-hydrolysing)
MKILAVSGTRADWGLLRPVLRALRERPELDVTLAVTGQHLAPGSATTAMLAADGFVIDHEVDMGLSDNDSTVAIGAAMGRGLAGFAELLDKTRPDLIIILGDRYEMLAVASAALISRVPIAHVVGGDVTEGAFDDAIRHAITKLSALHFVTNQEARARVIQMGEDAANIFLVGSPGIDAIIEVPRLSRDALLESVGLPDDAKPIFLVTFHPPTLSDDTEQQFQALLDALEHFPEAYIIFTGSNSDPGARQIDAMVQAWVSIHERAVFHASLGSQRYFSALDIADAVIGNSSSGLYEAPSFAVPTVNIGDRQSRRPRASSVIDCAAEEGAIVAAIHQALAMDLAGGVENPYGDGYAAERIADVIAALEHPSRLVRKSFKDLAHD